MPNKVLTKAPAPVYKPGETTPPTSNKPTIPVIEFPDHVEQLHQNSNVGFNREYNVSKATVTIATVTIASVTIATVTIAAVTLP